MIVFRAGEFPSARKFNRLAALAKGQPTPGRHEYAGHSAPAEPWDGWIKVTSAGSSGAYDWTEVICDSTGTLVTGYRGGTIAAGTAAGEVNSNNNVPLNTIVRAWGDRFGAYFQMEVCE